MDIGIVALLIVVLSATASFLLGRWLSRRYRGRKAAAARSALEASQSRQVRRARERQKRRGG